MSDEIKNENEAPKTEPLAELTAPVLDNVVGGVSTGKHIPSGNSMSGKPGRTRSWPRTNCPQMR
jgi:hypothetical protein